MTKDRDYTGAYFRTHPPPKREKKIFAVPAWMLWFIVLLWFSWGIGVGYLIWGR